MRRNFAKPNLDLSALWNELELPRAFPSEAEAAADLAVDQFAGQRRDATDIPFITVDPPGSMDLDQALHIEANQSGWTVHYAIADLAAFVNAGDPIDVEARKRGETLYMPDGRVPLHPPALGESKASLLPDQTRPAALWTITVDEDGEQLDAKVERASVRSRTRYTYDELQALIDSNSAPEAAAALPALGRARAERAKRRGAIDLGLPSQEVLQRPDGTWTLEYRKALDVETWNAQVSLLTGMAAAKLMMRAGFGVLRTLPEPDQRTIDRLRSIAPTLKVDWPEGTSPGQVLAGLDTTQPKSAAFADLAAELLRGAGYTAFNGTKPDEAHHAGVGDSYAHVTAPIRRLGDRFTIECCLVATAGSKLPTWVSDAFDVLPELLHQSGRRAKSCERAAVDHVEAWLLQGQVGQTFEAAVLEVDHDRNSFTISIDDPAIQAHCKGKAELGSTVSVRLTEADQTARRVSFTLT